jgi:polyferredoxin
MGIDIRNGPQYECITCSRCIDACDATMHKIGAEPNLIRYASQRQMQERVENPEAPFPAPRDNRWWRPRLGWYAVVLASLVGAIAALATTRPLLAIDVSRDRNMALRTPDGRATNLYELKVLNKDTRPRSVAVEVEGVAGELMVGENPITLAPGEIRQLRASIVLDRGTEARPRPFRFRLRDRESDTIKDMAPATFVPPG